MKASRYFMIIGILLLTIGLVLIGVSFIMGGDWNETLSYVQREEFSQYYRRNDNGDLDSDAIIWDGTGSNIILRDFSGEDIRSLEVDITNADIVITGGDSFTVTTDNIKTDEITCKVGRNRKLTVSNGSDGFSFLNIFKRRSFIIRGYIEITVPSGMSLENLSLTARTGTLYSDVPLRAAKSYLAAETGTLSIHGITSEKTTVRTGSGKLAVDGLLLGKTDVSCGSGSVELMLQAPESQYSYTADSGMGEVSVNGTVYSGNTKTTSGTASKDQIKMTCGSGYISVGFAD